MTNQNLHRLILSKAVLPGLCIVLSSLISFSQTTNISGVVNSYYRVIDFVPAKACVRVSSTAGLAANQKVLLVQMKGATINTVNTSFFGDTTSLNNSGNYEVGTICAIIDDSVFFVHTLLNSYTPGTGKVQLVRFGDYVNANVTGTVTAQPWNNTTGTGGVIAIFAEEDLILNANISADGSGFRGGAFLQSNTQCNNSTNGYAYDASVVGAFTGQRGAYKGETIVDLAISVSGGRGAPANGGGGGNNHNNSGGGGSNLTAGGLGGGNSSTSSCNAAFRGEGGRPLSSWGGRKMFMGGGGGAGHNNNGVFTIGGGHGGGLIFIHAANIIGNSRIISASGAVGGNCQADGAGGGGGGGTIIMDAISYSGTLTIEANGGAGGSSNNGGNDNLCYGGGGGGSGGVIYFSGATPAITVTTNAGAGGVEAPREPTCQPVPIPGVAGSAGVTVTSYSFRASLSLASYCADVLPTKIVFFNASAADKKALLNWQITDPNVREFVVERRNSNLEWVAIQNIPAIEMQRDYASTDPSAVPGYNYYRLKVIENNNAIFYSATRRVYITGSNDIFSVHPNPAVNKINIKGQFNGTIHIKLLDISGKTVLLRNTTMANTAEISLPTLPSGIYMLHINETVRKLAIR